MKNYRGARVRNWSGISENFHGSSSVKTTVKPGLGTGQESVKNNRGARVRNWSGIGNWLGTGQESAMNSWLGTGQESVKNYRGRRIGTVELGLGTG